MTAKQALERIIQIMTPYSSYSPADLEILKAARSGLRKKKNKS